MDGGNRSRIVLLLVTVPARAKTILEIMATTGAALDGEVVGFVDSCIALAAITPEEGAEVEVKHYMTSKLLVCKALIKVSMRSEVYQESCVGY